MPIPTPSNTPGPFSCENSGAEHGGFFEALTSQIGKVSNILTSTEAEVNPAESTNQSEQGDCKAAHPAKIPLKPLGPGQAAMGRS